MDKKNDILKSNIIFGCAQVIQMLTTILRGKLIAVFLGIAGMGMNAILQSMLLTVNNVATCGIMQSGVREISKINSEGNNENINRILSCFKVLVLVSSLLCFIIFAIGAWPLSIISFGNNTYIVYFVILGIGGVFYIFTHGEMTILQGMRQLLALAKSSILGSILSLIVCIPCYYFFGNIGIAISIVVGYLFYWLVYRFFRKSKGINIQTISIKDGLYNGRNIISLGFVLMIGTFLVSLFSYLTNVEGGNMRYAA